MLPWCVKMVNHLLTVPDSFAPSVVHFLFHVVDLDLHIVEVLKVAPEFLAARNCQHSPDPFLLLAVAVGVAALVARIHPAVARIAAVVAGMCWAVQIPVLLVVGSHVQAADIVAVVPACISDCPNKSF